MVDVMRLSRSGPLPLVRRVEERVEVGASESKAAAETDDRELAGRDELPNGWR
jgi:hypothetical protein